MAAGTYSARKGHKEILSASREEKPFLDRESDSCPDQSSLPGFSYTHNLTILGYLQQPRSRLNIISFLMLVKKEGTHYFLIPYPKLED